MQCNYGVKRASQIILYTIKLWCKICSILDLKICSVSQIITVAKGSSGSKQQAMVFNYEWRKVIFCVVLRYSPKRKWKKKSVDLLKVSLLHFIFCGPKHTMATVQ